MCVVSMIMDDFSTSWPKEFGQPWPMIPYEPSDYQKEIEKLRRAKEYEELIKQKAEQPSQVTITYVPSLEEFEALRKRFEEQVVILERLIKRAKQYDIENGEPDCEMESKKQILQGIADKFGIKINFDG